MIEAGNGPTLVLIPGLPGPWQFIRPAIDALASHFRVLTLSLGPECTLDADVARILSALDERRIDRAIIGGISFGGLVALRFAAAHPQRTAALVLVSAPGPGAHLTPRQRRFARWPHLLLPLFLVGLPLRLGREIACALPRRSDRLRFHGRHVRAYVESRPSFGDAARRARLIDQLDAAADAARISSPTLVVTGDADLDSVVAVGGTREYLRVISGAEHVVLSDTGHLGSITRPHELANAIASFVDRRVQQSGGPERPARHSEVA